MDINNINKMIQEKAFGELNTLVTIYKRTEVIKDAFRLMNPENLINIINNAANGLGELGIDVVNALYQSNYHYFDEDSKASLMPSLQLQRSFVGSLLVHAESIEMEINNYEIMYYQLLNKISGSGSVGKSVGAAVIGGAIGSLLGPIGTIIGGLAGGAIADESENNEINDFVLSLATEFQHVTLSVNRYLEGMVDVMIANVNKYDDACQSMVGKQRHIY